MFLPSSQNAGSCRCEFKHCVDHDIVDFRIRSDVNRHVDRAKRTANSASRNRHGLSCEFTLRCQLNQIVLHLGSHDFSVHEAVGLAKIAFCDFSQTLHDFVLNPDGADLCEARRRHRLSSAYDHYGDWSKWREFGCERCDPLRLKLICDFQRDFVRQLDFRHSQMRRSDFGWNREQIACDVWRQVDSLVRERWHVAMSCDNHKMLTYIDWCAHGINYWRTAKLVVLRRKESVLVRCEVQQIVRPSFEIDEAKRSGFVDAYESDAGSEVRAGLIAEPRKLIAEVYLALTFVHVTCVYADRIHSDRIVQVHALRHDDSLIEAHELFVRLSQSFVHLVLRDWRSGALNNHFVNHASL